MCLLHKEYVTIIFTRVPTIATNNILNYTVQIDGQYYREQFFLSEKNMIKGQSWLSIPITLWQASTAALMAWNPCLTSAWLKNGLKGRLCVRFIQRIFSLTAREVRHTQIRASQRNPPWLLVFYSACFPIVISLFEPWNSPWLLMDILVRSIMPCYFLLWCHGLHVYVPPNSYVETLISTEMVLKGGAFGK